MVKAALRTVTAFVWGAATASAWWLVATSPEGSAPMVSGVMFGCILSYGALLMVARWFGRHLDELL